jgi:hypothetical protein
MLFGNYTTYSNSRCFVKNSGLAAVALFASAVIAAPAFAVTPVSWSAASSDNWTSTTAWSTAPNFPNNGTPSGATYAATIAATGSAYTVTLNSDITVNSLTLNSANATLDQTAGTFTGNTITETSGIYEMSGGSIANSTLSGTGVDTLTQSAGFNFVGGTLNGDTFNGFFNLEAATIQNGLTSTGGALLDSGPGGGGTIYADGPSQTFSNVELGPASFVTASNRIIYPSGPDSVGPQTLTLASSTTVDDGNEFDNYQTGDTLVNDGTITSIHSVAPTMSINTSNFTNNGIVDSAAEFVEINATNWTNSATGVIERTPVGNGLILAGGTWTNNGTISDLENDGSPLKMSGAITNNGSISMTDGGVTTIDTISGSFTNNGSITIENETLTSTATSFVNTGTITLGSAAVFNPGTTLNVGDGTLAGGTTSFSIGNATINANVTLASDPSTLQFNIQNATTYDSMTINGNLSLAGNLKIFLNGFVPTNAETFTLVQLGMGGTLSGSFLNVANGGRLYSSDGGGSFEVLYSSTGPDADEIVLSNFLVPEPMSCTLLAGVAAMGLMRRRRQTI